MPEQLKLAFKVDDPTEVQSTYEVENIVGHKLDAQGEMLYEVKWKGYDKSENTYEQYKDFNSKSTITHYWKSRNQTNPHSAENGTLKANVRSKVNPFATKKVNSRTSSRRVK